MRVLKRIFAGRAKRDPATPAPDSGTYGLADNRRVYAIGDIHGRLDLLDQLHALIRTDAATAGSETRCTLVYLGDYIDRGPQSRQVVDRLLADALPDFDTVYLCGNHDDFLMKFLEDPSVGPVWFRHGGAETLASYGVMLSDIPGQHDMPALLELRDDLLSNLPDTHRQFFRGLRYSYAADGYFFAHAGVKPHVPLDVQSPYDLMWIREEFLTAATDFGKVVVHGHTPVEAPEDRPNRIGVDTGACWTGRLTAVALEGTDRRFLTTG